MKMCPMTNKTCLEKNCAWFMDDKCAVVYLAMHQKVASNQAELARNNSPKSSLSVVRLPYSSPEDEVLYKCPACLQTFGVHSVTFENRCPHCMTELKGIQSTVRYDVLRRKERK